MITVHPSLHCLMMCVYMCWEVLICENGRRERQPLEAVLRNNTVCSIRCVLGTKIASSAMEADVQHQCRQIYFNEERILKSTRVSFYGNDCFGTCKDAFQSLLSPMLEVDMLLLI